VSGVVEGGWEFVTAAYLVTVAVFSAYATSVFLRLRTEKRRAANEAEREARG
jgi:ABC-type transport system involved in Fe-S cluster assembly fused permease/ATPase subunit